MNKIGDTLVGMDPAVVMIHGPSKLLIDTYHWHQPGVGVVASYSPNEQDVKDHFGVFRGVDMIEAFAQATGGSCSAFAQCVKMGIDFDELRRTFIPLFLNIGQVNFHNFLKVGDVMVSVGQIKFYKFRQMVCEGRVYKVSKELDLTAYFKDYTKEQFLAYELSNEFVQVAELFEITGKAVKK
ncbi:hotdog family protein [Pedobacter insulae]|uniref:Uncharacterized protein n=1 Tax=Pedobacter insulae TaxID=414048 RepID=A0A1I2W3P5_9SPHI|nr:hypothetical protein [Pedobacter insulae]SFG96088.1 hypothetical protein SAMN04489864_103448 [Pedobacter insulae]